MVLSYSCVKGLSIYSTKCIDSEGPFLGHMADRNLCYVGNKGEHYWIWHRGLKKKVNFKLMKNRLEAQVLFKRWYRTRVFVFLTQPCQPPLIKWGLIVYLRKKNILRLIYLVCILCLHEGCVSGRKARHWNVLPVNIFTTFIYKIRLLTSLLGGGYFK